MKDKVECFLAWLSDLKAGKLGDPKPTLYNNKLKQKFNKK